jgi:DNA-binding transcriptional MerR regulator
MKQMDRFTIKDIEQLTGIRAHTLRVWEQRYGILAPDREGRKHRAYSAEGLKKALRVAQVYHSGMKISKVASLSEEEISRISLNLAGVHLFEAQVHGLIEASVDLDEAAFRGVMENVIDKIGLTHGVTHVLYPFLNRMGLLWMNSRIRPAQEHFASTLVRNRIIRGIEALGPPSDPIPGHVLLFSPKGEHHEIPLLFAHYLFRKAGWKTTYMGMDTGLTGLREYLSTHPVDRVFLHLSIPLDGIDLREYLAELLGMLPQAEIIMSGPLSGDIDFQRVRVVATPEDLQELTGRSGPFRNGESRSSAHPVR